MQLPYISRRLHRQIYFTVVVCLFAIVVITILSVWLADRKNHSDRPFDTMAKLVRILVPSQDTPIAEISKQLSRIGQELDMNIALYDANGQQIASYGTVGSVPKFRNWRSWDRGPGWRTGPGGRLIMKLNDGRWLVANRYRGAAHRGVLLLLLILGLAGVGVGLGALPFVRRLTGRLQRLRTSVEKIGNGDLSARAQIEGTDEVASLAISFNESAEKIEKLIAANNLLLANASHELRTPLSRIRLGVEMLKKKRTPQREQALETDIVELEELIEEILLMSRLDSNTTPKFEDTIDLLALAAEECVHYDRSSVNGETVLINGDLRLLRRMLRNLLDNASKHGEPPIVVKVVPSVKSVSLIISDEGPGIPQKDRKHVFDPFYRSSGKQNVEGFGLGLALVKQIAEHHGGTAKISEEHPSSMIITFPNNMA